MIVFKVIRWKNLLSTGNTFTEVSLNAHNQTLIVGENGAGKSTILDALSFALYGKPFRKVNKSHLLNSINNKGIVVEEMFLSFAKISKILDRLSNVEFRRLIGCLRCSNDKSSSYSHNNNFFASLQQKHGLYINYEL